MESFHDVIGEAFRKTYELHPESAKKLCKPHRSRFAKSEFSPFALENGKPVVKVIDRPIDTIKKGLRATLYHAVIPEIRAVTWRTTLEYVRDKHDLIRVRLNNHGGFELFLPEPQEPIETDEVVFSLDADGTILYWRPGPFGWSLKFDTTVFIGD